jgi:CHAT domain-containing protein
MALCIISAIHCFSQEADKQSLLLKSDSLYAIGVDLYNSGKYKEAIPLFTESDQIDKAILDSTSNRRDYSAMWLASCYYKENDIVKAMTFSPQNYLCKPVDRRMTVQSDSLVQIGYSYLLTGDLESAIKYYTEAVQTEHAVLGENWFVANTLIFISNLYMNANKNKSDLNIALQCASNAARIIGKECGEMSLKYAETIKQVAKCCSTLGNHQAAKELLDPALNIIHSLLGDYNEYYVTTLILLTYENVSLEDYNDALKLSAEALKICNKIYNKDNILYANAIMLNATSKSCLNYDYDAVQLFNEADTIYKSLKRDNSYDYISLLTYMANSYDKLGLYERAQTYETKALNIIESLGGKNNLYYSAALNNIALYNMHCGNYSGALKALNESLTIKGKSNIDYAITLSNVALCQTNLGNYTEANKIGIQALDAGKRSYGTESLKYATILNSLGTCCSLIDNYQEAIRLTKESSKIRKGKDDYAYAISISNLAGYYYATGDYGEAIRLSTEALAILANLFGKTHLSYAKSLLSLATYQATLGNLNKALDLRLEAVNAFERYSDNYADNAHALCMLISSYASIGEYQKGLDLLPKTMDLLDKAYAYNYFHPSYIAELSYLAFFCYKIGRSEEAITLEQLVLDVTKSNLGTDNLAYANYLSNLALFNTSYGDYKKTIEYETNSLEIKAKILGEQHLSYVESLLRLGLYNYYGGSTMIAINDFIKCSEITKQIVNQTFTSLTTMEKSRIWNIYKNFYYTVMPSLAYAHTTDSLVNETFSGLLFSKGLLLDSETAFNYAISTSSDETVVEAYNELKRNRTILNRLYSQQSSRQSSIDSLSNEINNIEHNLISRCKEYNEYKTNILIDTKDIKAKLTNEDIAIEFASFQNNDTTIYCAYLLRKYYTTPKMKVCLKSTKSLNSKEIRSNNELAKALSQSVWGSMIDELSGVKNIYFSPSGEFNNIPIENLPDWEIPNKLISDRWNLYRLSSTSKLALTRNESKIHKSAVYGGLIFNADTATVARYSRKYGIRDLSLSSQRFTDSTILRDVVQELPGTRKEAIDIDNLLRTINIVDSLYTDSIGTESSFKALSGKKINLLHIATHGFYWTEKEIRRLTSISFLSLFNFENDKDKKYEEDKALTRSGLLFTGANNTLMKRALPEGVDDGILTAQEISQLDLRGLNLAVLSACDTGLGEITSDGVFGLQRGFKKAGAQSIMMSLWKVNDEATQMLMTQFYTNLTSGKSKRQSLLDAQRYLREYEVEETVEQSSNLTPSQQKQIQRRENNDEQKAVTRKVHPYADPKYWAAFILLDAID